MQEMPARRSLGAGGSHMDHEAAMTNPQIAKKMEADMRRRFWISFLLSIPIFLYSPVGINFFGLNLPTPIPVNWLLLILTTPIVFWTGSIFITGTYYSLKAKKLNMAVLIATGVLAAYLFSVLLTVIRPESETFYEAAALLVTFVLFGHWMEMKSRKGTSDALRALFDLVPPKANVIRGGKEMSIPSAEITHDDIVVLRPGDKVPVDGEIVEGETAIDESLVTGESMPVTKTIGVKVVGGSVNLTGMVKFKATQVGSETVLAQIIKMVETAQNSKAPGQRIADKAAGWLVILAIGSGLAAFMGWYFVAGVGLLVALTFAISTVVIACPDALGLATPTAVAVGTGLGAKHNILIKDAATLENTSRLTAIVLDKTGTLTEGKPKVTDVLGFNGFNPDQILLMQAAIGSASNHPISKAIVDEAKNRKLNIEKVSNFESISGFGLKGIINGQQVLAGKEKLLTDKSVDTTDQRRQIDSLAAQGKTLSLMAIDNKLAGIIAVADTIKSSSKKAITALKELGLEVAMITGDHTKVAEAVGKELGIDRIFAEVLPQDKEQYVKKLQDEGKFVAMVGDGINDAPALARADIGIAIGAGTDVAIETGNIVLMKSDPYDIVAAIRLSKATVRKMKQNLFWAAIYNLLAIPVAAGVFYNSLGWTLRPEMAALLMSASSIIVATNAVLLKRVEPKLKI
ncbi:MAG: copper-translocating P-type ATPase [Candidatus Veblenbacteria bacterium RIFOXYC1_FULL_42_9]|uniref:Copper-translocating P-type ATPase n=4 Tax=Candidatus Vebleniibacteriota TaxID=1817921 RepID=A0A1G2Q501_9BACT|nr:MAG: copper-translocating P-type ATPase [Candidatus Veblenbacteria bacterium RIFOXYC1_FULL_42_9]OHA55307.1 MAG: copper-translocating P-type ATPase [Candidatus Veblenbacteria bacterium RIFOXYA2_FULL_43_9]OHA55412.1 MAG: copper-translocating P-type ATPase [Candidatus Veblenbacteria bacterium RIFOXYB1_FULL_43_13]OHA56259.1 MAG: copper-translocating P-type ATPase [Candidatus Veblenbacteria bacterium RIFOXYD1_FULL_43_11]